MKRINGTWIELHHLGLPEGKYFNDQIHNFTDEQWHELVKDMASFKMKYLVLMQTGFVEEDDVVQVYYNSKYYKRVKHSNAKDPIEAILDEADKQDMKVFVSVGFYGFWRQTENNMKDEKVFDRAFKAMEEVYSIYGHHKSFFGWYLPDETEINPYYYEFFIDYCNRYKEFSDTLNKDLKVMIAPYGTCKLKTDDYFIDQLKRLNVDFVAYQDEVGVKKTTEDKTAEFYKNLKHAHDVANKSKLWADMEVFTFEGDVYKSALLPADINRIKKQMEVISPYIEELLIFEYQCSFARPNTKAYCGADGVEKLYEDYKKLLDEIEK